MGFLCAGSIGWFGVAVLCGGQRSYQSSRYGFPEARGAIKWTPQKTWSMVPRVHKSDDTAYSVNLPFTFPNICRIFLKVANARVQWIYCRAPRVHGIVGARVHRIAPHRTAPHRTAPHRAHTHTHTMADALRFAAILGAAAIAVALVAFTFMYLDLRARLTQAEMEVAAATTAVSPNDGGGGDGGMDGARAPRQVHAYSVRVLSNSPTSSQDVLSEAARVLSQSSGDALNCRTLQLDLQPSEQSATQLIDNAARGELQYVMLAGELVRLVAADSQTRTISLCPLPAASSPPAQVQYPISGPSAEVGSSLPGIASGTRVFLLAW